MEMLPATITEDEKNNAQGEDQFDKENTIQ